MTSPLAVVEKTALYLGHPWKFNRTGESSDWRFEVIDGAGHILVFSNCYSSKGRFQVSGAFPPALTSPRRDAYKTISVSTGRPPKDIAVDVSRRLIPHYLEAFDIARAARQQEQEAGENLNLIGEAIIRVTGGRFADQNRCSRTIYFDHGKAVIWTSGDIKLSLSRLSPETAIKIAAIVSAAE